MSDWQYDAPSRRYRSATTGRYVSASSERAIRDDFIARKQAEIVQSAQAVAAGDVSVAAFERSMQRNIRELHGCEYAFGRGGRRRVTEAEWARLGGVVAEQERYLAGFAAEIAAGTLSEARIAARAALYADAARASYHRGTAATYDGLRLPAMPGDGGTPCLVKCLCAWRIEETAGEWECTWVPDGGEHCSGCVARSRRWAPYVQAKPLAAVAA